MPLAPPAPGRGWPWAACAAVALPTLIAYNLPPSATFLNQAAALVGWGIWLLVLASAIPPGALRGARAPAPLWAALGLLLLAGLASPLWTGLPWSLALSSAGALFAAGLAAVCATALQRSGLGPAAFRAFCIALLVAGVLGAAIGLVQVFAPGWADGTLVARSSIVGRAVGNLRQPNQLSSFLLWGLVALVWLAHAGTLRRGVALALGVLLLFGVVLSGSRTGAIGALVLALWGWVDRRHARGARRALMAVPLVYVVMWAAMVGWASLGHANGVATRFGAGGDISSSRFGIWSNTLELIRAQPWAGVGWGEFNFAWSLTPFPHRPVAFFDHTHNLALQFAVELGLPLAALVLALLAWALLRAGVAAWQAEGEAGPALRAAFVMLAMVALHSQLEYPLWYVYFLLPTGFVFGLCLGATAPSAVPPLASGGRINGLAVGGVVVWLAGLFSLIDYARVVVIFAPPDGAPPLARRIADGQRSLLFSHHADYAAATTPDPAGDPLDGFKGAPHYLLDARLMQAWAKALDETGDTERASHVAARLKEFRNEESAAFFEVCEGTEVLAEAASFPCRDSTGLGYRDFR